MNVRIILALTSLSAVLIACGPAPDDKDSAKPPKITGGVMGVVSPFDTLQAEFTTDLEEISAGQVESSDPVQWSQDEDMVKVFGDSTYITGVAMFLPGTTYTVTFSDLESTEGEFQDEPQSLTFETMILLDKDGKDSKNVMQNNNDYGTAEILADSAKFFNGVSLKTGVSVAGIISGIGRGMEDRDDWFRVQVKEGDSLEVQLTNLKDNLRLRCFGPENEDGDMSSVVDDSDKKGIASERLVLSPTATRHSFGTRNLDSYLNYWIRVSPTTGTEEIRSSYVLTVKKIDK